MYCSIQEAWGDTLPKKQIIKESFNPEPDKITPTQIAPYPCDNIMNHIASCHHCQKKNATRRQ